MIVTIVDSQLGDEGKGALVDLWGGNADIVIRYQDGDNTGHTVVEDGKEYRLSLVSSGVVHDKIGVLGNGCVVNLRTLFSEVGDPRERGLDPNVRLTKRAHIIMLYHRRLNNIEEEAKADSGLTIGTTSRDIDPTYEDKAGHRDIRVSDLLSPNMFRQRLEYVVPQKETSIEDVYGLEAGGKCGVEALVEEYTEIGRRLREDDIVVNCGDFLAERYETGNNMMFEGAQGTLIDIDHGSYPYMTSSNPTADGAATGTGVSLAVVERGEVIGIVKSYLSRVGKGPMPTELRGDDRDEELTEFIRERGGEPGTVTGRPRRIG